MRGIYAKYWRFLGFELVSNKPIGAYKTTRPLSQRLWGAAMVTLACTASVSSAHAQMIDCNGRLVTPVDFQNSTLISGTNLQAGAIYRFDDVTAGVDARVEVLGFTGGATLGSIDTDAGLVNFFQPELNASQVSSVQFLISFVEADTTIPIELDIAASAIDVDGNNNDIREYAEFEDTLVESLLSNPTQLDQNASGPAAGMTRFESRTTLVAPGIDETATANIVTVFYTDISSFEYTIGALGNGTQTRLTSLGFTCPNIGIPVVTSQIEEDFGDAPASFGNPIHTLVAGIQLGASNTADDGPFDSPVATGDNGDDGVSAFPPLTETLDATIPVNVTGAGGFLQAWFDFNGDGDFDEANEQIATNLQDGDGDGLINIDFTVPGDVTTDPLIARLRWSTSASIAFNTAVSDGEVEDYLIGPITQGVANVTAAKTVEVFDPANQGLYLTPGNEVIYRITATNADTSNVAATDINIMDTLPDNVAFISAETIGFTSGAFGSPDLPAANTDCGVTACVIRYSGASLDVDSAGEVIIRALIK